MNDPFLKARLRPVLRRQRQHRLGCQLALCWLATLLIGLVLVAILRPLGVATRWVLAPVTVAGVVAAGWLLLRQRRTPPDWGGVAHLVEARYPELDGRLITAAELHTEPGAEPGYLQRRLVDEALDHSARDPWNVVVPRARVALAQAANLLALALLVFVFLRLPPAAPTVPRPRLLRSGLEVTPEDTSLERGQSLVVMARFGGAVPANVDLVLESASQSERRVPLVKSLSDPLFGATVPDVKEDLRYRLEYSGQQTRAYRVTVFDYPRLERADAALTYPEFTRLAPQRIADTRRVSAVEGSQLDWDLQLNKPVASARLVPKQKEAAIVPLDVVTNRPAATLRGFPLAVSRSYDLQLVDAEGRTNKVPAPFMITVLTNRTPELKLASPRGDLRPSALEEILFEGRVWDDFGVEAYGLAYTVAGQEPQVVELGRSVPAKEQRPFRHLLRLEELGLQPDQLVAWHVWADDLGPDGQVRRTAGDLFFGEIRPFEEIFREGQGQDGQGEQQANSESAEQPGNPSVRLAELQKQIINATWKLQRERPTPVARSGSKPAAGATNAPVAVSAAYEKDAIVVRDSQAQALEQAEAALAEVDDPRTVGFWNVVTEKMEEARERLEESVKSRTPLPAALSAEQAAYQALLKLQQREYEVARSRSRSRGQQAGSRQQQMQRQLDQLDLTQSENRYETERQAQAPQSPERREQLQVLNRLQELARRQQDVNERLQELQTALQQARTETEREELRRQLKRLQEEEQQMLADADELQQRLDRPENQARLAEQRRQMEQARQNLQRAAEAAGQGSPSQALAAGTRAQEQLQQARDDLRRASAGEFDEELRTMRAEARDLAREQTQIQNRLDNLADTDRKRLDDSAERQELLQQLAQQKSRLTNVVERATQVSQQAEATEPLVSRELYDSLRKFSQDEAQTAQQLQEELVDRGLATRSLVERVRETAESDRAKAIELTAEMLRQGYLPQADRTEERARAGIGELRRGIERAAERVLGDDTEALRMAQRQLDDLTRQIEREITRGETGGTNALAQARADGSAPTPGQPGAERSDQAAAQQPANAGGPEQPPGQPSSRDQASAAAPAREGAEPGQGGRDQANARSETADREGAAAGPPNAGQAAARDPTGEPGQAAPESPPGRRAGQLTQPDGAPRDDVRDGMRRGGARTDDGQGTGGFLNDSLDRMFGDGNVRSGEWTGPITGDDFAPWSDRLREVEEMVDLPSLRSEIAAARERARRMRLEYRHDLKKPDWAVVRLQVMRPLVEVRQQIADELARREPKDNLVPIDRDPVPTRYSELVRRYYEDLGKASKEESK